MKYVVLLLVACSLAPVEAQDAERHGLEKLAWLTGSWTATGGKVEEHWIRPAGQLMLGMNRDLTRPKRTFFEYLRIEDRAEGIFYVASPMGQGNTDFQMVLLEEGKVIFENTAHDFPKRIIYIKTGPNSMKATVEGDGPNSAISWTWHRAEPSKAAN